MKAFFFLFAVVVGMVLGPDVYAEHVYPFQGYLNLEDKKFMFSIKMPHDASLDLKLERQQGDVYQAVLDVQGLQTPFFDMTTEVQSVIDVHKENDKITSVSGAFWSQYSLIDHKTVPEMRGRFDLKNGSLRVDDLIIADFHAEGSINVMPPHQLNATIGFDGIDLAYFLDWLSGEKKKFVGGGEIEGEIALSGTPGRIAVKSNIVSDGGYVEHVPFDRMVLHLQGVYPLVDLTNSTITKTNGFSFDLDGTVDVSDKKNMAAQIASLKKLPLIKENNLQSEWVLKRVQDAGGNSNETKYFMKTDKGIGSGPQGEDYGVFGVEREIGF